MHYTLTAGAPESPVLLHAPHDSRTIPAEVRRRILLDDAGLTAELDRMTDAHTALIAERAAGRAAARPWVFANRLSRLVVDPERFPDDREEMRAVGMGAVYTRTSSGERLRTDDADHEKSLLTSYFEPYAEAMADAVDARLAAAGRVVIIDVHSYPTVRLPYELHTGPRPEVCLGTDARHTPPWLSAVAQQALSAFEIGLNSPFAGTYVPLRHYGTVPAVAALMVEIRRDRYMREHGGPTHEGLGTLVQALTALIDETSTATW
ncbi:N-formylglutamate amidohydrolase [Nocardia mexicana]|uniref:N-formylglutamate amidohydrolase n=1 Tax=Nocardia mexicana TaxID=279262 RepID=A0A370GT11_9NOCA|nr:N-formylglutamate amidohydrolase [Nocardia mexicana]RDI46828.1 N-formylglutamate amidohydrolase [Nocardia mexicana]